MGRYKLVKATLKALKFKDDLLEVFVENDLTDSVIECCVINHELAASLKEINMSLGQRVKFLKKFSDLKFGIVTKGDKKRKNSRVRHASCPSVGVVNMPVDSSVSHSGSDDESTDDEVFNENTVVIGAEARPPAVATAVGASVYDESPGPSRGKHPSSSTKRNAIALRCSPMTNKQSSKKGAEPGKRKNGRAANRSNDNIQEVEQ
ncbi:unnamed protein product, partial [Allacma fusca]